MMDMLSSEREKLLDEKHVEIVRRSNQRNKRSSNRRNGILGFAILATAVLYFTSGPCHHHSHRGPNDEEKQWQSEGWFPSRSYPPRYSRSATLLTLYSARRNCQKLGGELPQGRRDGGKDDARREGQRHHGNRMGAGAVCREYGTSGSRRLSVAVLAGRSAGIAVCGSCDGMARGIDGRRDVQPRIGLQEGCGPW